MAWDKLAFDIYMASANGYIEFKRRKGTVDLRNSIESIEGHIAEGFLATARCASYTQAARTLNVHPARLRKQLRWLESGIGEALFIHQDNALLLTPAGQSLQQRLSSRFFQAQPEQQPPPCAQVVRLAIPESILSDVVGRYLIDFLRKNAAVRLEVTPLDHGRLTQGEVMVWLADPDQPRPDPGFAMTPPRQLARLPYHACIAKRYAREPRLPCVVADLRDYMLVQQQRDLSVVSFEPWNALVRQRHNSVAVTHAHQWSVDLIKHAACVGLMPGYITRVDPNLQLLKGLFSKPMEQVVWLSTSPLAERRQDVALVVKLIRQAFDERREWFDD